MSLEIELAWAAGFFDGEGCFHAKLANNKSAKRIPCASISQKHREVLDRFCKAVGVGKVYGPYAHGIYRYVAVRQDANVVATKLWPYLGSLKKQAWEKIPA
jgi:hypothetical protein